MERSKKYAITKTMHSISFDVNQNHTTIHNVVLNLYGLYILYWCAHSILIHNIIHVVYCVLYCIHNIALLCMHVLYTQATHNTNSTNKHTYTVILYLQSTMQPALSACLAIALEEDAGIGWNLQASEQGQSQHVECTLL